MLPAAACLQLQVAGTYLQAPCALLTFVSDVLGTSLTHP